MSFDFQTPESVQPLDEEEDFLAAVPACQIGDESCEACQ